MVESYFENSISLDFLNQIITSNTKLPTAKPIKNS